jgi:hypothetical protein
MKKQIAPYIMPICTGIAVVIAVVGLVMIAARALSTEAWDYVWGRM